MVPPVACEPVAPEEGDPEAEPVAAVPVAVPLPLMVLERAPVAVPLADDPLLDCPELSPELTRPEESVEGPPLAPVEAVPPVETD